MSHLVSISGVRENKSHAANTENDNGTIIHGTIYKFCSFGRNTRLPLEFKKKHVCTICCYGRNN